jgi:hypothetical protein
VIAISVPAIIADEELRRLWANLSDERFVPYFVIHVSRIVSLQIATLLGGLFLGVRPRGRSVTTAD